MTDCQTTDEPVPGFLIVPDALYDAIHKRLDEAFAECPEAEADREHLYRQLLDAFSRYGTIPEFSLEKVK